MKNEWIEGERFQGIIVETYQERPNKIRVRPVGDNINVEISKKIRENYPIGTRFRIDVKVCTREGKGMYLFAARNSIERVLDGSNITEKKVVDLSGIGNDSSQYIEAHFEKSDNTYIFSEIRDNAYEKAKKLPEKKESNYSQVERLKIIKAYALIRANGYCEGCKQEAPFLKRNGDPYLEVHHVIELSNQGSDSPDNVIALCPNCHARVTHGQDGVEYNNELKKNLNDIEALLD